MHDFARAVQHIRGALQAYDACYRRWTHYLERTQGGAVRAADGLEVFSTIAITVSTTVISGGITAGLLGRAGASAGISGLTSLVRETAVQGTERALDLREKWDVSQFLTNAGASAASAFVSSLLGGWLRPYFERLLPLTISEETFAALNEVREMGGQPTLTRLAWQSFWSRFATRILAAIPAHLFAEAYRATVQEFGAKKPASWDGFFDLYIRNLERVGIGRAIGQAMLSVKPGTLQ